MKLNTKLLFLLLVFATLFLSCNKDSSDDGDYYVKMKIDGNWVTWKKVAGQVATETTPQLRSGFSLMAKNNAQTEDFNIQATVDNLQKFVPGTYTPDNSFLAASYTKFTSATDFKSYTGGGIMGGADTRYELIVTSVTDKVVKGSFSGTFLRNIENDDDLIHITEGEFSVQIIP
jgi:hypothetical protein